MTKRTAVRTETRQANPLYLQITDCFSSATVPHEVQSLAKKFLQRSGELIVSSSMTLRTAITALRSHDHGSPELTLLEAVFHISEKRNVPPKILMRALASGELGDAAWAVPKKNYD